MNLPKCWRPDLGMGGILTAVQGARSSATPKPTSSGGVTVSSSTGGTRTPTPAAPTSPTPVAESSFPIVPVVLGGVAIIGAVYWYRKRKHA